MREGISNPPTPGRNPRIVWTGAILVIISLSLLTVVGEWFAAFDACVANPVCNAGASPDTLTGYLALMVAGVGLAVVGVIVAFAGVRGQPPRAMIVWV